MSKSWSVTSNIHLALVAIAVLLLQGCSSTSGPKPPVAENQIAPQQEYTYLVAPGDTVEIFVWSNPELTSTVPVRPDGKITTRLVEEIEASGKTPSQLARDIEKAYSEYVKNAVVSVIVNGFVGVPYQQVRVLGEAQKPASIPFRKHMTLLDLMIEVGGLTDFADGNNAVLIRLFEGKQQSFIVRLDDLVRGGDITANIALWPGDIIIIPESWF